MSIDQKRLAELLEEATVDCYDEEFSGVFSTLLDNPEIPLQAKAMGNMVEVVGNQSSPRWGILAHRASERAGIPGGPVRASLD